MGPGAHQDRAPHQLGMVDDNFLDDCRPERGTDECDRPVPHRIHQFDDIVGEVGERPRQLCIATGFADSAIVEHRAPEVGIEMPGLESMPILTRCTASADPDDLRALPGLLEEDRRL